MGPEKFRQFFNGERIGEGREGTNELKHPCDFSCFTAEDPSIRNATKPPTSLQHERIQRHGMNVESRAVVFVCHPSAGRY